jgi:hypothetical protein
MPPTASTVAGYRGTTNTEKEEQKIANIRLLAVQNPLGWGELLKIVRITLVFAPALYFCRRQKCINSQLGLHG